MALSHQVEWALHCAVVLAGLPPGKALSAKVLSEFHGIPKEYLSKALQSLANAGLIEGITGPTGGYFLSRPADSISFLDIVTAIEGSSGHFLCEEIRKNNPCRISPAGHLPVCGIAKVMGEADEAWREVLQNTSLMDLLATLPEQIPPEQARRNASWFEKRWGQATKKRPAPSAIGRRGKPGSDRS